MYVYGVESITRYGQCNVRVDSSARTERIFQSRHEGKGWRRRESGERAKKKKSEAAKARISG
jgi:hypothetical protein